MSVTLDEWLGLIEHEYAATFIPFGGAAWRFAVGDDATVTAALDGAARMARRTGLVLVPISAAATRVHMIHELVHAICRHVPWQSLAQRFMERLVASEGYSWPTSGESLPVAAIARANDVDAMLVRRQIQQAFTRRVMREPRLSHDFRAGISLICDAAMDPEHAAAAEPVLNWLRGNPVALGDLRQAGISARLNRTSARVVLRSVCSWIQMCGGQGLCLAVDLRQVSRPGTEGVKYTQAAVLDAFEVLRQLIDDSDALEGVLGICVSGPEFIDEQDTRRSVSAYTALKARIWSDVSAHERDNPLAPLVRLSPPGGQP